MIVIFIVRMYVFSTKSSVQRVLSLRLICRTNALCLTREQGLPTIMQFYLFHCSKLYFGTVFNRPVLPFLVSLYLWDRMRWNICLNKLILGQIKKNCGCKKLPCDWVLIAWFSVYFTVIRIKFIILKVVQPEIVFVQGLYILLLKNNKKN